MSRNDCLAAGLAQRPSTNPPIATGSWSCLATLASLAIGLVSLPLASSAQVQRPGPEATSPLELPVSPAATTPAEASVSPAGDPTTPAPGPARIRTGLVTIESDQQRGDQLTGVITATGNVRIVYPDERVVATSRQAQYFSREGRVVLSGDVDIIQEGGNLMRAEQVIYLVESERMIAIPPQGQQVFSQVRIPAEQKSDKAAPVPAAPAQPVVP